MPELSGASRRDRLRLLSLTSSPPAPAAQVLAEPSQPTEDPGLGGADLAMLSGHPAGQSQRTVEGRLGTALWEVFPGHVALLDRDGFVVAVNRAWREFGLANGATVTAGVGMNYLDVCDRAADEGEVDAAEAAALIRAALAGDRRRLACRATSPAGERWFNLQVVATAGRHSGALVIHEDVTAEKLLEQELARLAFHDPLTGLANRALLSDRLEHAIAGAARDPRSLAVLFIDLDAFKSVNDRFGHLAGDAVLVHVATRMAASVRDADTIGRWGGDEFLVIAERLDHTSTPEDLANRLAASLHEPMTIGGRPMVITATIGIAHLDHHQDAEHLIKTADQAMLGKRRHACAQAADRLVAD